MTGYNTAIGSTVPIWTGSSGGSGPTTCQDCGNTTPIDLYISPNIGNDANLGTIGSPIATIQEAVDRLLVYSRISVGSRIIWHLDRGPHTWVPIPQMLMGAGLLVYADPAFDPLVRTVIATGAAQAGTGQSLVVTGGGLLVDAYIKNWVMFTTGAAAGQPRSIRNNTVTDIVPLSSFSGAVPVAGDTWVVFNTNCRINAPTVNGPIYSPFTYGQLPAYSQYRNASGLVLFGLFLYPAPNNFWSFGAGNYEMYGCTFAPNNGFVIDSGDVKIGGGTTNTAFLGQFFSATPYVGYGNVSYNVGFGGCVPRGPTRLAGFVSCDQASFADGVLSAKAILRASTVRVNGGKGVQIDGGNTLPSWISYVSGGQPMIQVDWNSQWGGGELTLFNTLITGDDAGPLIRVSDGGYMGISATFTGQNAGAGPTVQCRYGSRISVIGAPVLGDAAANDWDIEDGAPFNKSFFATAGSRKHYLGNLVVRTL